MSFRKTTVAFPGTLGEWVQGWILEDGEALVSLVVDWEGMITAHNGFSETPLPEKSAQALGKARTRFCQPDLQVILENPLPVSRGLGSSTVDVAGTFLACAQWVGVRPNEEELLAWSAEIEPSDGLMCEGLALVDHLRGRVVERLPAPPPLFLVALLPRRTLNTEDYRKDKGRLREVRRRGDRHRKAYAILRDGLLQGNPAKVCAAATLSALLQQAVLPREEWPLLLGAVRECRGRGVAVAHSGTASAVLFSHQEDARRGLAWLSSRWDEGDVRMLLCRGGGPRIIEG